MKRTDLEALVKQAECATDCLKALAHESRLIAVCYIGDKEKSVQEIEQFLGTTQSNISQHLAKLRDKGVLQARKEGNQVFYSIKRQEVLELIKVLQKMYCEV